MGDGALCSPLMCISGEPGARRFAQEAGGDQKRGKKEPGASRRLAGKVGTARQPGGGGEPRPFCTFALEVGLRQACFFWVLVKKPHRSVMESECEG